MINPNSPDYTNTPASPQRPRYFYRSADPTAPPLVTIVTPFYKIPPEIFAETTRSVLNQSFQPWAWLIINDASPDFRLPITNSGLTAPDKIRVINHAHNKGLSAARNTGFREAKTEFVVMLDADDLLEPTALEKWFWFLVTHPQYAFTKGYAVEFGSQTQLQSYGFEAGQAFLTRNQLNPRAMVRRAVWQSVGGFDEQNRDGLEDWDFWLHCASAGHWGATVPEYLDWYRRRPNHADQWANLNKVANFRKNLQQKYPQLYRQPEKFFSPQSLTPNPQSLIPCDNLLLKPVNLSRLLVILPDFAMNERTQFNLDLMKQLTTQNYELSICTTQPSDNPCLADVAKFTPDIFNLPNFLAPLDFPRFLLYFLKSRQIETVLISHSYLGYQLLPLLQSHYPAITFMDYLHTFDENCLRASVGYQAMLDLSLVSSPQLKQWLIEQGGNSQLIEVYNEVYSTPDGFSKPVPIRSKPTMPGHLALELARQAVHHYRLAQQINPPPLSQDVLNNLSSKEISQRIPIWKIIKAISFKIRSHILKN